jgi:MoaA/NifB/PqqE/SkfB family radical SAM enzyme
LKTHLALITTTRCNFRCAHCIRGRDEQPRDLALELLERALPQAYALGITHAALTGGEAGMHPRFEELADLLLAHGFTWSMVTNGWSPERYADSIRRSAGRLTFIAVSFDGAGAATHDARRMQGSFEQACRAVRVFVQMGVSVRLTYLAVPASYDEAFLLPPLALSLGASSLRYGGLIPVDGGRGDCLSSDQRVALAGHVQVLGETIPATYTTSLHLPAGQLCGNWREHEPSINPYGEYLLCCDTPGRGLTLGSLADESFEQLYLKGLKAAARVGRTWRQACADGAVSGETHPCLFCAAHGAVDEDRIASGSTRV